MPVSFWRPAAKNQRDALMQHMTIWYMNGTHVESNELAHLAFMFV